MASRDVDGNLRGARPKPDSNRTQDATDLSGIQEEDIAGLDRFVPSATSVFDVAEFQMGLNDWEPDDAYR
ncbi:MAG TPA: hypothetical protein VFR18_09740, partial [Terriglobia bacterium]|nr:hypothetical protein [Terriglobia bacterium]